MEKKAIKTPLHFALLHERSVCDAEGRPCGSRSQFIVDLLTQDGLHVSDTLRHYWLTVAPGHSRVGSQFQHLHKGDGCVFRPTGMR